MSFERDIVPWSLNSALEAISILPALRGMGKKEANARLRQLGKDKAKVKKRA